MSWFTKARTASKISGKTESSGSVSSDGRMRSNTDPETCLEVFRNHWEQAWDVIQRRLGVTMVQCDLDEVEIVTHNFEQMMTLLGGEEGADGTGMPGPILHYILEHDILEKYCSWCCENIDYSERLQLEQLRLFEMLLGQSRQLLLIHKPVIIPLLKLLSVCAINCKSREIEGRLVLVLHQICASIAQETSILESFIYNSTDHGRTKFLIFSLLIPYLHREGTIGQQARDALLLIMALSSRHPYIVKYIADFSDFCPVLATGLSGLYSALPRKLSMVTEDSHCLTDEDVMAIPELQMFLNSLEFCNAVVQIAHCNVTDQLISYIYNGFLVPVLSPALNLNSREEIITATLYLNIFLKRITEPALVKAFLTCIMVETFDDVTILDSLISRINSNTQLCLVTLSLFKTLIDLNCEDLMFQLIFRYLIPCTHVMVSQKRAVRDVDLYGKSAEKFLSLRPSCCVPDLSDSPQRGSTPLLEDRLVNGDTTSISSAHNFNQIAPKRRSRSRIDSFLRRKEISKEGVEMRTVQPTAVRTNMPHHNFGNKLEHYETSYMDYLHEARYQVEKCYVACNNWSAPYDGEKPDPRLFDVKKDEHKMLPTDDSVDISTNSVDQSSQNEKQAVCDLDEKIQEPNEKIDKPISNLRLPSHLTEGKSVSFQEPIVSKTFILSHKSFSPSIDHADNFLAYLGGLESPPEYADDIEDSMFALDNLLTDLSLSDLSQISQVETDADETVEGADSYIGTRVTNSTELNNEVCNLPSELGANSVFSEPSHVNINGSQYELIKLPRNVLNSTGFSELEYGSDNRSQNNLCLQENSSFVEISMSVESKGDNISQMIKEQSLSQLNGANEEASGSASSGFYESDMSSPSMQYSQLHNRMPSLDVIKTVNMGPPDIGPFLKMLFSKLDLMMQSPFEVNLMLTGLIARLAAFPQPLLRSFLLNHNLVFQPTVKSLTQVLTTVRQKVDAYSYSVKNFEQLLLRARETLATREEAYLADLEERSRSGSTISMFSEMATTVVSNVRRTRSSTSSEPSTSTPKERRRTSLTDRLFKRSSPSPKLQTVATSRRTQEIQMLPGKGMRYVSQTYLNEELFETPKTRNAVYCAVILEEFVKELAAYSHEHAVLYIDEGYASS